MAMIIIKDAIAREGLKRIAEKQFGELVKAVVDVEKEIMAVGGELHADEEALLMEQEESKNENLWGINLYPEIQGDGFIEFDSMINMRPSQGNRSRGIENEEMRKKIIAIVAKRIKQ